LDILKLFLWFWKFILVIFGKHIKNSFNPIPARILENQDMLGGGFNFPPPIPPLNHMFDVQIWQGYIIGKLQIFKDWNLFWKIQLYSKKCLQKKMSKKKIKFTCLDKHLNVSFRICKNICKILSNLMWK